MKNQQIRTIELDSVNPYSKKLASLLKKHDVTMQIIKHQPYGVNGWAEVELKGTRENLNAVLTSEDGWGDGDFNKISNFFSVMKNYEDIEGLIESQIDLLFCAVADHYELESGDFSIHETLELDDVQKRLEDILINYVKGNQ